MRLLIATNNLHKIREYKEMFKALPSFDISSLRDIPQYLPPKETGTTFIDNALIKAKYAFEKTKILTIADHSGLVVPSLNGEPGILSSQFAEPDATDAKNRKKLLEMLKHKKGLERAAFFEVGLALVAPNGLIKTVKAISEGIIVEEERGKQGYGYDSLFLRHDYSQTFGELDESVKNRISHRRKAFEKLRLILENLH